MPSIQQIYAATNIRNVFLEKRLRYALLVARCQAGKTGAYQELIRLMLENGDIERAYILCGSNETELRDQAHADTKLANAEAYADGRIKVIFRQDFKNAEMNITRALIVIDESHLDQTLNQQLDRFLGRHGLSLDGNPRTLIEKDAYMVSVDATPYSELSAVIYKESHPKHVEQLAPGAGYFGIANYKYGGLIKPTYDISKERIAFKEMVLSKGNKYAIIRLPPGKNAEKQEATASAVYRAIGGNVVYFTAEKTEISIASLKDAPAVPTLIIVRGRLRAGKVVCKKHISFVWEGACRSNTDAIVQGLLGRMCGYEFGDVKPLIFVPQSAMATRDDKVLKASEIDRAIMEYPIALPTSGMNLKKGHIASAASNGKTQCPPLRLTWPSADDDEWTPEMDGEVTGDLCRAFLLKHQALIQSAPFSNSQKEEIAGFITTATAHTRTLTIGLSSSFNKYFSAVIEAYNTKTAVAEKVATSPQMTFFITKDACIPHTNKRHLYVIFHTDATNGASPSLMAVDIKSRIPMTNGKSVFSIHDSQVDQPLVAGGVVGFDENKIKDPRLLEKALRAYMSLSKGDTSLIVARCIQSNKERFALSRARFHYSDKKNNDVERICAAIGLEFRVKMKVTYTRSAADYFNVKKIEWS